MDQPRAVCRSEGAVSRARSTRIDAKRFAEIVRQIKDKAIPLSGGLLPDLTVELWNVPDSPQRWIGPFPPINGCPIVAAVLVKNVGPVPVDVEFNSDLYVDGKLAKSRKFTPVDEEEDPQHRASPLMPGGSRIYGYKGTFSGGSHTFRWVIDTGNAVSESDESKSSNELQIKVDWKTVSELGDLVVESISTDGPLVVGAESQWNVKIKNISKTDIYVAFMTSLRTENSPQFGAFWLNSLAQNDSQVFVAKHYSAQESIDQIMATVDTGSAVPGAEEDNNSKSGTFTTSYVDLEARDLVVTPQVPVVHEPVALSFKVTNSGPVDVSKPFKIRVMPGKVSKSGLVQPALLPFPGFPA